MALIYGDFQTRLKHPASTISHLAFDHRYYTAPFMEHSSLAGVSPGGFFKRIANCVDCTVALERYYPPVLPRGDSGSNFVWIGRNPGRQEGAEGEPFYPKAPGGRYLDIFLSYAGLARPQCYITNTLFCFTQNDRKPTIKERHRCTRYKPYELSLLTCPKFIFLLGADAFESFLPDTSKSITDIYGYIYKIVNYKYFNNTTTYLIPIYHPGSIIRKHSLLDIVFEQLAHWRQTYLEPYQQFLERNPSVDDQRNWQI